MNRIQTVSQPQRSQTAWRRMTSQCNAGEWVAGLFWGNPSSLSRGGGRHSIQWRSSAHGRIAEHSFTLCFTHVCNWKQDLAKLLLNPESWNLLKSGEILKFNPRKLSFAVLQSPGTCCWDGSSCSRPSGPGAHVKLRGVLSQMHCWTGRVSAYPIYPACCGTCSSFL